MKRDNAQASATLSKPEAVWRAIEELGYHADVQDILEYVRTRFGIDADTPPAETIPPAGTEAAATRPAQPPAPKPTSQRKPRSRGDSNE